MSSTLMMMMMMLLDSGYEYEENVRHRKRYWTHHINRDHEGSGQFATLYEKLREDEERFWRYFRMSTHTFDYILEAVCPQIHKINTNYRRAIPCEERLMVTIRYLSTGLSYGALSDAFKIGTSTVHYIISEVCEAVWNKLTPIHMPEPSTSLLLRSYTYYMQKWNFPNCVGAIDGKHIRLKCPANSGSMYYNYKGYYSIVLQALADAEYKFISIKVGAYGKQSDGGIFSESTLYQRLENGTFNMPADAELPQTNIKLPFVIVGDEAYPLTPWLMRPFPRRELNDMKRTFNERLSRARRVVESSFGILTAKWRLLQKPIETSPALADKIVKCMCGLHNIVIDKDGIDESLLLEIHNQPSYFCRTRLSRSRENTRNYNRRAQTTRLAFAQYFSMNPL